MNLFTSALYLLACAAILYLLARINISWWLWAAILILMAVVGTKIIAI
jgi:hypothetical protein